VRFSAMFLKGCRMLGTGATLLERIVGSSKHLRNNQSFLMLFVEGKEVLSAPTISGL